MTKKELIDKVAGATGVSKKDTDAVIAHMLEQIAAELEKGGSVQFVGFGSFEVRERAAREGRNPQTGKTMTIAAAKAPVFKAGKNLKDRVNK